MVIYYSTHPVGVQILAETISIADSGVCSSAFTMIISTFVYVYTHMDFGEFKELQEVYGFTQLQETEFLNALRVMLLVTSVLNLLYLQICLGLRIGYITLHFFDIFISSVLFFYVVLGHYLLLFGYNYDNKHRACGLILYWIPAVLNVVTEKIIIVSKIVTCDRDISYIDHIY